MYETAISRQLSALCAWQNSQLLLLDQLQSWLRQQTLLTAESDQALQHTANALRRQRLTIAVTGDTACGKTELLNALFFADLGYRLLPTDAGRTTMCLTEIFHDPDQPAQLRLLPIETRTRDLSMKELRQQTSHWQVFPLPMDHPETLTSTLRKLSERRLLDRDDAAELGALADQDGAVTDRISVPRWRLAQINIPHPLLTQGLCLLDTPGLHGLETESELADELLSAAHAIMFAIGTETGVTQYDMKIWQRYVRRAAQGDRTDLAVVLNKSDSLWDRLQSPQDVTHALLARCGDTAETLGADSDQVFAVSAYKALLAQVRGDGTLQARSGLDGLAQHLGETVIGHHVALMHLDHVQHVRQTFDTLETIVRSRIEHNDRQRRELLDLASRSDAAIQRIVHSTRNELDHYATCIKTYRHDLHRFQRHARRLLEALDPETLEHSLTQLHAGMVSAWTTNGLRDAMRTLFDEINARLARAGRHARLMRRQLRTAYQHFANEHQYSLPPPVMLSLVCYQVELSLLEREAEIFRNSPRTTWMEQHLVTKRYFDTIVVRVRRIIGTAHTAARHWAESVTAPLSTETDAYRETLTRQLADLQTTADSRQTVQRRIDALRREGTRLQAQIGTLHRVSEVLTGNEHHRQAHIGSRS